MGGVWVRRACMALMLAAVAWRQWALFDSLAS